MISIFSPVAFKLLLILALFSLTSSFAEQPRLEIEWEHLGNELPVAGQFTSEFKLKIPNNTSLPADGWALYFNFGRKPVEETNEAACFIIQHVNGDLFRIVPKVSFYSKIEDNDLLFKAVFQGSIVNHTDAPSGFYLVLDDGTEQAKVVEVDKNTTLPIKDSLHDRQSLGKTFLIKTPQELYLENKALSKEYNDFSVPILPLPVLYKSLPNSFAIDSSITIQCDDSLSEEAAYLAADLFNYLGQSPAISSKNVGGNNVIHLRKDSFSVNNIAKTKGDEAYQLLVSPDSGIEILGTDSAGIFYGIQTLRALVWTASQKESLDNQLEIKGVRIEDAPEFKYRGLHLDVARNFQSVETVKKLIDLMATYKLNQFHFHLTDDEGWRLAIPGLPELTEIGSKRGFSIDEQEALLPSFGSGPQLDVSPGSGFYSTEQFIDILKYAAKRHIKVIPEIDLPGHSRAAIRSMAVRYDRFMSLGQYEKAKEFLLRDPEDESIYESVQMWNDNVVDVCLDSTYAFIQHVVSEIEAMYSVADIEFSSIHIGGDEVPHDCWSKSTYCKDFLDKQIEAKSFRKVTDEDLLMDEFLKRLNLIVESSKINAAGWEEVFLSRSKTGSVSVKQQALNPDSRFKTAYVWNNVWGWGQEDAGYRLANAGIDVVLCHATNLYFDLAYSTNPNETGYYWAGYTNTREVFQFDPYDCFAHLKEDRLGNPITAEAIDGKIRLATDSRKRIKGIQGHLWGENMTSSIRLESMAFPRLLALAERAWSRPFKLSESNETESSRIRSWADFSRHLGTVELLRLDKLHGGVEYHLPNVGAWLHEGYLNANVAFPGIEMRYTDDGSDPTSSSHLYHKPIAVKKNSPIRLRSFNSLGRGSHVTEIFP